MLSSAFRQAFGALEARYEAVASEHGWRPQKEDSRARKQGGRFRATADWLKDRGEISTADSVLAHHLCSARNVVAHKYGFEPSIEQVQRTILDVKRLCSRFSQSVGDVMTSPVITASPDQPVGELLRHMVEGISQFPVVDKGELLGTLTDVSVLDALARGDGILDPVTPVREVMDGDALPAIGLDATIEEVWRKMENTKKPALLVLANGLPVAIVTKYDLLRRLEL